MKYLKKCLYKHRKVGYNYSVKSDIPFLRKVYWLSKERDKPSCKELINIFYSSSLKLTSLPVGKLCMRTRISLAGSCMLPLNLKKVSNAAKQTFAVYNVIFRLIEWQNYNGKKTKTKKLVLSVSCWCD